MSPWTPGLDELIVTTVRRGGRLADAARAVRRHSGGKFDPHASTVLRRLRVLGWTHDRYTGLWVSTRVDAPGTSAIPPRVRAPLAVRAAPPSLVVLSIPFTKDDAFDAAVSDLLLALPPGWTWRRADPDETRSDTLACAQHQARLRGDELVVLENSAGGPPVVAFSRSGKRAHIAALIPVYFERL